MSIDASPFPFSDPKGQKLQHVMAGMYPDRNDALGFVGAFGVNPLAIPKGLAPLDLWRDLLERLAISGNVRSAVTAARDQFPRNQHASFLAALLAEPASEPAGRFDRAQPFTQSPGAPPLPEESVDITGDDFSDSVDRYFVGRRQFREDFSRLCGQLDTQGSFVYWLHGIGGLGKSFFLRRVFLDVPHSIARCLVDWDDATNRYRSPLRDRPRSIVDVFDAIARSLEGIVGTASLGSYRSASIAVKKAQAQRARLERRFDSTVESLVTVLKSQRPDSFPQIPDPPPDQFRTDEGQRQHQEREVLLGMFQDEPVVRTVLGQLKRLQRSQEEFFDFATWDSALSAWISNLSEDKSEALGDPGHYLVAHLSSAVAPYLKQHSCVLMLDTQEVLSRRLNWYVLRFLDKLEQLNCRLLTVIASRFQPDHGFPQGSFSGWRETLKEKIRIDEFSGNVHFTRANVIDLLERLRRPPPADLGIAERILSVTFGIPMAVGIILSLHERGEDIVALLADFKAPDALATQQQTARRIIGEVASRFLLHLDARQRDEDALRDVILLSVAAGGWTERLQELWWGGRQERRNRLITLSRQVDFLDGSKIRPEAGQYFKDAWRDTPHRLLPEVIDRARLLMESKKEQAEQTLETLADWQTTYASIVSWQDADFEYDARLQASLLRLADPQIPRVLQASKDDEMVSGLVSYRSHPPKGRSWPDLFELERSWGARGLHQDPKLLASIKAASVQQWPRLARASWHLILGLAEAEKADEAKAEAKKIIRTSAVTHFREALKLFGKELPNKESVFEVYFESVARLSISQDDMPNARAAIEEILRDGALDGPNASRIWLSYGKLLHNVEKYDESNAAYRRAMDLDSQLWIGNQFIAHNYQHQGKSREVVELWATILREHPDYSLAAEELVEALPKADLSPKQKSGFLRQALSTQKENPAVLLSVATFFLSEFKGRTRAAQTLLSRIIDGRLFKMRGDETYEKALLLSMIVFGKMKDEREKDRASEINELDLSASTLNSFAWKTFTMDASLMHGLEWVDRALLLEPDSHYYLNTRFGVLCGLGRWDEALKACSVWLKHAPLGHLRKGWHDHRLIFRLAKKSMAVDNFVELTTTSSDPDFKVLAHLLVSKNDLPNEFPAN